jgi:hypothetical protein
VVVLEKLVPSLKRLPLDECLSLQPELHDVVETTELAERELTCC